MSTPTDPMSGSTPYPGTPIPGAVPPSYGTQPAPSPEAAQPYSYPPVPQPGYDPNAAYPPASTYDPNAAYPSVPQPGYDPNGAYPSAPQPGYDPNAAYPSAPQPGYDPNAAYPSAPQPGYDPSGTYPPAPQPGYDPGAYGFGPVPGDPFAQPPMDTPPAPKKKRRLVVVLIVVGVVLIALVVAGFLVYRHINTTQHGPDKPIELAMAAFEDGQVSTLVELGVISPDIISRNPLLKDSVYAAASDRPTGYILTTELVDDGAIVTATFTLGANGPDASIPFHLHVDGRENTIFDHWVIDPIELPRLTIASEDPLTSVTINGLTVSEDFTVNGGSFWRTALPGTYRIEQTPHSTFVDVDSATATVLPGGGGRATLTSTLNLDRVSAAVQDEVDSKERSCFTVSDLLGNGSYCGLNPSEGLPTVLTFTSAELLTIPQVTITQVDAEPGDKWTFTTTTTTPGTYKITLTFTANAVNNQTGQHYSAGETLVETHEFRVLDGRAHIDANDKVTHKVD